MNNNRNIYVGMLWRNSTLRSDVRTSTKGPEQSSRTRGSTGHPQRSPLLDPTSREAKTWMMIFSVVADGFVQYIPHLQSMLPVSLECWLSATWKHDCPINTTALPCRYSKPSLTWKYYLMFFTSVGLFFFGHYNRPAHTSWGHYAVR